MENSELYIDGEMVLNKVLTLGIRDFVVSGLLKNEETKQAISWFHSDIPEGSFGWICDCLDYNTTALREGIILYKKEYEKAFKKLKKERR